MIKVGMLRQFNKPNTLVLAAAIAAKMLEMEFFFFNPKNIDFDRMVISGLFYEDGQWIRKETSFPDVVDNSPARKVNRQIYARLEEILPFTTHRIGNKDTIYKRLKQEMVYQDLLIPTRNIDTINDVISCLAEYKKVIIKPEGGNKGKGIYYIENKKDTYLIIANREKYSIPSTEIDNFVNEHFIDKNYIIQPYIKCLTKDLLPYDIRIHVRRDFSGKWKIIRIYPRIGTNDGMVSNLSQGGYIAKLNKFLKRQFGDKHLDIERKLTKLGREFPVYFQKAYENDIDALGIDIGIDEDGKLWLFEVNSFPGSTFFELEAQITAMSYAKYVALNNKKVQAHD